VSPPSSHTTRHAGPYPGIQRRSVNTPAALTISGIADYIPHDVLESLLDTLKTTEELLSGWQGSSLADPGVFEFNVSKEICAGRHQDNPGDHGPSGNSRVARSTSLNTVNFA